MSSEVTIQQADRLLESLSSLLREKEVIEGTLKEKNKEISRLEFTIAEVLDSLDREKYSGPAGDATFVEDMNVKMPVDENKHLLWDWMRERQCFDRYATVNANSLKALFRIERENAIAAGEDPMTFALPGMAPATFHRRLKFKPKKKVGTDGNSEESGSGESAG